MEKLGLEYRIPGGAPIGMAPQFEQQRDSSQSILRVKKGLLRVMLLEILAPLEKVFFLRASQKLELRICPASLLDSVQRALLPKNFEEATTGITLEH